MVILSFVTFLGLGMIREKKRERTGHYLLFGCIGILILSIVILIYSILFYTHMKDVEEFYNDFFEGFGSDAEAECKYGYNFIHLPLIISSLTLICSLLLTKIYRYSQITFF